MEWYFARDINDLTVPKDEVMFDCLPSSENWSQWGNIAGNINSPKKLRASSVCPGSRHSLSQQSAYTDEHSDGELDDLGRMDEADDIFFRSIFEADASEIHGADSSPNMTQISRGERNHVRDCRNNGEDVSPFSRSKDLEFEIYVSEDQSNMYEDISDEDISTEELALLELQRSSLQLSEETRICFRDSLYRLAENSRHQTVCSQNAKETLENRPTTSGGSSRSRESKAEESVKNAIDRTIANLLFDTMNFYSHDAASPSDFTEETPQRAYDSRLYHSTSDLCLAPGGDIEVPTCGYTNI